MLISSDSKDRLLHTDKERLWEGEIFASCVAGIALEL